MINKFKRFLGNFLIVLMTINCFNLTKLQVFAVDNAYIKGDVNGDGILNDLDLELIKKHYNGSITLDIKAFNAADLNNDGDVTLADYGKLLSIVKSNAYVKGDVNGDGILNDLDLELIKKHYNGSITLDTKAFNAADLNDDGKITLNDVSMLKEILLSAYIKGDVNGDGILNDLDLDLIMKYIVGSITLDTKAFGAADLNGDSIIDSVDTASMQRLLKSQPAMPTISTTNYVGGKKVTISCSTQGTIIYYTTDGSTPTTSSAKYIDTFNITSSKTIKAIAVYDGYDNNSELAISSVSVIPTATPTISTTDYIGGKSVTISCATNGAAIYYTTDGSTPTTSSAQYKGVFNVTSNKTIKVIAICSGYTNSSVASSVVQVNQTAIPTISTANYIGGKKVTITCSTNGATIYYTTDGSTPTTVSAKYTGAFKVTNNKTIKAIAVCSGYVNSTASTSNVNVGTTAAPTISTTNYVGGKSVTISCTTNGAEIYYTTDGSTPTTSSTKYTGAFTTNNSVVVNAIALSNGNRNSDITKYTVLKTCKVTYNLNGGTPTIASQQTDDGSKLTLSKTIPTKTGYSFAGWADSATATIAKYTAGQEISINSDITLYAIWTVKTYDVSYNANGGMGAPGSQTKTHGTNLTLSSTKPIRDGYEFKGWGTSSSMTTVSYQPGEIYSSNSEIILYAIWTKKTYTISYNANEGTGTPGSQTKTHGTNLTLSSTKPIRDGYEFKGWGTSSSTTTVSYQPGEIYSSNSEITLYAIWTKDIQKYEMEKDSYQFSNNVKAIYNKDYHEVDIGIYKKVLGEADALLFTNPADRKWKGSCYGMSVTSLLFFKNNLKLSDFTSVHDTVHKIKVPSKLDVNSLVPTIEEYQISQFARTVKKESNDNTNKIGSLIKAVENFQSTGEKPIILSFYKFSEISVGHAIVPYKCDNLGNNKYRIYAYDSNTPDEKAEINITFNMDEFDKNRIDINNTNGTVEFVARKTNYGDINFNVSNKPAVSECSWFEFCYVETCFDVLNSDKNVKLADIEDEVNNILISTNSNDITIKNSDGVTFKDGIEGAYEIVAAQGDVTKKTKWIYSLPVDDYVITNNSTISKFNLSVSNGKDYIEAETNNAKTSMYVKVNKDTQRLSLEIKSDDKLESENKINILSGMNGFKTIESTGTTLYVESIENYPFNKANVVSDGEVYYNGNTYNNGIIDFKPLIGAGASGGLTGGSTESTDENKDNFQLAQKNTLELSAKKILTGGLSVYVQNNTGDLKIAKVNVGIYTENGKFIDTLYEDDVILGSGQNYINVGNKIILSGLSDDKYIIKCFVWDSLESMKPLADACTIEVVKNR